MAGQRFCPNWLFARSWATKSAKPLGGGLCCIRLSSASVAPASPISLTQTCAECTTSGPCPTAASRRNWLRASRQPMRCRSTLMSGFWRWNSSIAPLISASVSLKRKVMVVDCASTADARVVEGGRQHHNLAAQSEHHVLRFFCDTASRAAGFTSGRLVPTGSFDFCGWWRLFPEQNHI